MSAPGNVAQIVDGETHHDYLWNEKNMHYFTNKSGGDVASGDVVILDTANAEAFTTTTTAGDPKVLGVIPQKDGTDGVAADQTIADGVAGMVQFAGDIAAVKVDGTTVIGDFLIASTTVKKATPVTAWQAGVFAVATSACTGAGTVSAKLIPVSPTMSHTKLADIATKTHTEIDSHLGASAQVHGLPAGVNVAGNADGAGRYKQSGFSTTAGSGTKAITFPKQYAHLYSLSVTPAITGGHACYGSYGSPSTSGFTAYTADGSGAVNTDFSWEAEGD